MVRAALSMAIRGQGICIAVKAEAGTCPLTKLIDAEGFDVSHGRHASLQSFLEALSITRK